MKLILALFFLSITFMSVSQETATFETEIYSINYPESWEVDDSKARGTDFLVFCPLDEESPNFRSNFNIGVQNLEGYDFDLESFHELSVNQVKNMMDGYQLISSETLTKNDISYKDYIYQGSLLDLSLTFHQQYFVFKGDKAIVLTYTTDSNTAPKNEEEINMIFDSFTIK